MTMPQQNTEDLNKIYMNFQLNLEKVLKGNKMLTIIINQIPMNLNNHMAITQMKGWKDRPVAKRLKICYIKRENFSLR
jgi:hypothetical protein